MACGSWLPRTNTLRLLLGRQLARLGVEATTVADGEAAVRAQRDGSFDAVLLDLRMPVVGGLEAARRIRAAEVGEERARTPILALTADTSAEGVDQCFSVGIDGHLPKPVGLEALRRALGGLAPGPPAHTAARPREPLVDEAQLDDLAAGLGGRDALDGLLAVFRKDLDKHLGKLRAAVKSGISGSIREEAHALRSGAVAFGAVRLAEHVRGLEDDARRGNLATVDSALAAIASVVSDTDAALQSRGCV